MLLAGVCLAGSLLIFCVFCLLFDNSKNERAAERLRALQNKQDMDALYQLVLAEKKARQRREGRQIIKVSKQLEDLLAMSGVRLAAREYLCGWLGLTFLPAMILFLCGAHYLTIIAGSLVGFSIPPVLVRQSRKKRRQQFDLQLGDCLIIISNCLRSGFSFQQAMGSIAEQMQPPVSVEFARVLREMKFGVSLEAALNHMSRRMKSDELDLMISAVLTSSQIGANLVDILEVCTSTINDRVKIKNDIRVLSAQGRMSGLILSLLPVAITVFLMFLNPTYLTSFFDSNVGKIMIVFCLCMEMTGFLVIRKLVDVRY
jgi:tight adherence protein B